MRSEPLPSFDGWACPTGMVPVGNDGAAPAFCIDAYEARATGDIGDPDQFTGKGRPATATAVSAPGVLPTIVVSFGQAAAICANTEVLNHRQERVGFKRMVTSREWSDAADGVLGDGGTRYVYGDTWNESACATPRADGSTHIRELSPTGSHPACVSRFGVYDAVGNAWEWSDSEERYDITSVLAAAKSGGLVVSQGDGDTLLTDEPTRTQLGLEMAGLDPSLQVLSVGDGGVLRIDPRAFSAATHTSVFKGHLLVRSGGRELGVLPVAFTRPDDGVTPTPLLLLAAFDGAPIPHKRGCAYYTGSEYACRLGFTNRGHLHDFNGLISFRCAADPFPTEP